MFSEVYWHHAVRAATAMFQRAFYLLHSAMNLDNLFRLTDARMIDELAKASAGGPAKELLDGLFGEKRRLYKRLAQFSFFQERELYVQLARKPYRWLTDCAAQLATVAGKAVGQPIAPHEILIDAPPMKREVEFNVEIFFTKEARYRPLAEVSPVVRALATSEFDDYVKRVRIFVHPRIADDLRRVPNMVQLVRESIAKVNSSLARS
jgi:HD superfamily phosphohydrolase